jgi:hypothetical protein
MSHSIPTASQLLQFDTYLTPPFYNYFDFPADPFGTFLKRLLADPQGGQDQLLGSSAHAFGPFVNT